MNNIEQLIKKDCRTNDITNIYPVVPLEAVKDVSGKSLDKYLNEVNHIFLPWKNNTRKDTRLQVPSAHRRKGLWVTYVTCRGQVVTEWYNSDSTNNEAWADGKNWVNYMDPEFIKNLIRDILSWYIA